MEQKARCVLNNHIDQQCMCMGLGSVSQQEPRNTQDGMEE